MKAIANYTYFNKKEDQMEIEARHYKLWQAVINQAKRDLTILVKGPAKQMRQMKRAREEVIEWIQTEDFLTVCCLAGLPAAEVYHEFDELIRR